MYYDLTNKKGVEAANNRLNALRKLGQSVTIEVFKHTRTNKVNSALHLYFTQVADLLNEKGITHKSVADIEVRFTPNLIKYSYFHPIMYALFNKQSTTELTNSEINEIFDIYSNHISEITGEFIPFPSIESIINK